MTPPAPSTCTRSPSHRKPMRTTERGLRPSCSSMARPARGMRWRSGFWGGVAYWEPSTPEAVQAPLTSPGSAMSDPVVVLLVEDEPLVRILLSELLTESGFRVVEAANAQEALTILGAELDVRVMLTNVDMPPGLNGYELARHVHELWPGVGILVTSGRQRPTNGDLPRGAAFLAKPMPNEVLVSYVKAAVERSTRAVEDMAVEVERTVVPFPRRTQN